ncbi:MAG: antitoxin family protein [Spirochaetes bacterium]|nr:antitoxin family protein [Spirochaetota bacterium]
MVETVNAVYENGILKPLNEIHISNGMKVKLIIESDDEESIDDILNLATGVYEGLSDKDIKEVEEIAFDRKDFFQ